MDTRLERADDGHYRKHCDDCGYVGGPYTSSYAVGRDGGDDDEGESVSGQASLGDFA